MLWLAPGASPVIDHTSCAVGCVGAYRSTVATIWPSILICALPRSGPTVETRARLVAGAAFEGWAVEFAVADSWTEPPKALLMFTPLQVPLKLELKLLSVSGTWNDGLTAKVLTWPCLSTAWTLNW